MALRDARGRYAPKTYREAVYSTNPIPLFGNVANTRAAKAPRVRIPKTPRVGPRLDERVGYSIGKAISPRNIGRQAARIPFIRNRTQGFANSEIRSKFLGGPGPKPWLRPTGSPASQAAKKGWATRRYGPIKDVPATLKISSEYEKLRAKPRPGPRIPLGNRAKSGYKAVEKASMKIPARRFVLGGAAILGAGYMMNKVMNRSKDNFYTHYYDY